MWKVTGYLYENLYAPTRQQLLSLFHSIANSRMKFTGALLATGLLFTAVESHPGGHHVPRVEMQRRAGLSKRCANHVAQFNEKRYARRMRAKRSLEFEYRSDNTTHQITTEAPYYEVIQNDTCVLAPDITQGPYLWPRAQILRQDMSEDQPGVPLWLDVGVIDMATCEPLDNALVSFWHCNSTGNCHLTFNSTLSKDDRKADQT